MFKILIWGTGTEYSRYINCIKYLELKEQIQVVAVVSNDLYISGTIDGYRYINKGEINVQDFDYCLIAVQNIHVVMQEAVNYGIQPNDCIPIRVVAIPGFDFCEYINLKKSAISIFSVNCFAGICYNYLGLPFLSPTINMFESTADFTKMMKNLDYYMSAPVEYIRYDYEERVGHSFPIARIDDVILQFLHYDNFDGAAKCWEKRKQRINKGNIFVVSHTDEKKELFDFEEIPYEHKVIFTSCTETSPSSIYIDKAQWDELWEPVIAIARGDINLLNIISLLNYKDNYLRV